VYNYFLLYDTMSGYILTVTVMFLLTNSLQSLYASIHTVTLDRIAENSFTWRRSWRTGSSMRRCHMGWTTRCMGWW